MQRKLDCFHQVIAWRNKWKLLIKLTLLIRTSVIWSDISVNIMDQSQSLFYLSNRKITENIKPISISLGVLSNQSKLNNGKDFGKYKKYNEIIVF